MDCAVIRTHCELCGIKRESEEPLTTSMDLQLQPVHLPTWEMNVAVATPKPLRQRTSAIETRDYGADQPEEQPTPAAGGQSAAKGFTAVAQTSTF